MPDRWLREQTDAIRHLIEQNKFAIAVTLPDGRFIYANQAVESLLGYNRAELLGTNGKTWKELTANRQELTDDETMVAELVAGIRDRYEMVKSYVHKLGHLVKVEIQVIRWPQSGPFECFLVTFIPVDAVNDYVVAQLESLTVAVLQLATKRSQFERFMVWVKENPAYGLPVCFVVAGLILGDRVIEILAAARLALGG